MQVLRRRRNHATQLLMNGKPHAVSILEAERDTLRARLDDLSEQIRDAKNNLRSVEHALQTLTGDTPSADQSDGTVRERVLNALPPAGSAGLTPKDIADRLTAAGRPTTNTTVSSILSRLKDENLAVKLLQGGWVAASQNEESRETRPSQQDDGGEMVRSDGYPPARSGGSIPPTSTGKLQHWSVPPVPDDDDIPF